jgi:hypothetical protein
VRVVEQVEAYREHARECREMAGKALTADHRRRLLELAAQWEALAEDREKLIKTQQRLNDL